MSTTCPRCNAPRSDEAPGGLCPLCLMANALASDGERTGSLVANDPGRVLETLTLSVGPMPHVFLPDTNGARDDSHVIKPSSSEIPPLVERSSRVQLLGEIARGGMGAVLKGRDPDLGRDLAVKVLLETHRDKPEYVRRFVEEAQIGGQLQHPGIVPVYELGTFGDTRPYFTMKLVKGRTLAELLAARSDPTEELPRFLGIFEQIAQTVAYAHARGVIHRDLKPSNVMVGSFGEVQVMDWGLAKVLPRGGVGDDASAGKARDQETVIATARSSEGGEHSQAGSVMGTPSYMAPEQARGEIDRVDERADVFALGSILCLILTGQPAFVGRSPGEIQRKAAIGETADALARLEVCGADGELIALARDCLAREPEDRPGTAQDVARRVTSYLAGVQEKLRNAERQRAVAETRAIEERKRRRLQLGLAAALLALTTLGGLGAFTLHQQRSAKAEVLARVIAEALTLRNAARSNPEDLARWKTAMAAILQAREMAGGDPEARRRLELLREEVLAGALAAERDRDLFDRLIDIRSAEGDDPDGRETEPAYADAFKAAGIDFSTLSPAEAGAKLKARPPAIVLAMAAALDDWASVRRGRPGGRAGAERLIEAARIADPDPWRNDLRVAIAISDKNRRRQALKALAETARFDELGAVSLDKLGRALVNLGETASAEAVLRRAQRRHPGDLWINHELAQVLERLGRRDEAIRFYTAAAAVRPETAHELAHALAKRGESDEAIEIFQQLARLREWNGRHLSCLGDELKSRGRTDQAAVVFDQAAASLREMIRTRPDDAGPYLQLGNVLKSQGKLDLAIAEFREAIRLQPDYASAHNNLGITLRQQGKLDLAIAEYREAIRLQPDDASTHNNLSVTLRQQGKLDLAIAEYREAIRLKPDYVEAHYNLGNVLQGQGKLDEAGAAYREAIRLKPDFVDPHYNLAIIRQARGEFDQAAAEYLEVIRLKPDFAEAHCNLGGVLKKQGDFAGSLAMYRRGHELGSRRPDWRYPSAQWVAEAERMAALAERFPALLRGVDQPKDAAERLVLARMCFDTKWYAATARFLAEALEADPSLGNDRQKVIRYNAASAALMAASGQGKDDPPLDDSAKVKLRGQALEWLKAELAAWSKLLESGPPRARPAIVKAIQNWRQDANLAIVRDPEPLSKLPEDEQKSWRSFWDEFDALRKKAELPGP